MRTKMVVTSDNQLARLYGVHAEHKRKKCSTLEIFQFITIWDNCVSSIFCKRLTSVVTLNMPTFPVDKLSHAVSFYAIYSVPTWNNVNLEQLIKKLLAFYSNLNFITVVTRDRYRSLF